MSDLLSSYTLVLNQYWANIMEIRDEYFNRSAFEAESPFPDRTCRNYATAIPDDALLLVLEYLDSKSLGNVQAVDTGIRQVALKFSGTLWSHHARHEQLRCYRPACVDWTSVGYLQALINRTEVDLRHYEAALRLHSSMYRYAHNADFPFRSGIVGMLGDLCMVEDPQVAHALSRKRAGAVVTIVVRDIHTIEGIKKIGPYVGPVSYMPLTTTLPLSEAIFPAVNAAGFIGYALDLIKLRPEHEYLRPAVYTMFRGLMVFGTLAESLAYRRSCTGEEPWLVALDQFPPQQAKPDISQGAFRPPFYLEEPNARIDRLRTQLVKMNHSLAYMLYGAGA